MKFASLTMFFLSDFYSIQTPDWQLTLNLSVSILFPPPPPPSCDNSPPLWQRTNVHLKIQSQFAQFLFLAITFNSDWKKWSSYLVCYLSFTNNQFTSSSFLSKEIWCYVPVSLVTPRNELKNCDPWKNLKKTLLLCLLFQVRSIQSLTLFYQDW